MRFFPVATAPTIVSLNQMSLTSVTVDWSLPSGDLRVDGYVIHYSDGITNRKIEVGAFPTKYIIRDLINGHTYAISLEATSTYDQILSGESENMTITLSESRCICLEKV